jgi:hypothetical protein
MAKYVKAHCSALELDFQARNLTAIEDGEPKDFQTMPKHYYIGILGS